MDDLEAGFVLRLDHTHQATYEGNLLPSEKRGLKTLVTFVRVVLAFAYFWVFINLVLVSNSLYRFYFFSII